MVVLGMFGIAPSGSHGRRLLAAWLLLELPVALSALFLGAGLLWLAVLPTLALGLVTFLAPRPPV